MTNDTSADRVTSNRRKFLSTFAVSATMATVGALTVPNHPSAPDKFGVEISLFTSEYLTANCRDEGLEPFHATEVAAKYIEHSIETLSTDETDVYADITIVKDELPGDLHSEEIRKTRDAFSSYLQSNHGNSTISTHSNVFLTDNTGIEFGSRGFANIPDWRMHPLDKFPTAVVIDTDQFLIQDPDDEPLGKAYGSQMALYTPAHEVGHNLGFEHLDGYATYDREWAAPHIRGRTPRGTEEWRDQVYSTIMMGRYINREHDGDINSFGDQLPDTNEGDDIMTISSFNPKLDVEHLYHTRF